MANILIVEDDNSIQDILEEVLKNIYKTYHAYSGTEALLVLEKENIDLILLDLMLPGLSGEEIITKVKNIPIIVITAKIDAEDKVKCLLKGANDYITKPFDIKELLARIKVQLRLNPNNNKKLVHKNLELLDNNHTLKINNLEVKLTKTEYAIFKQLLLNYPKVISKDSLLNLISKDTLDCDENSLKVHISNIRKKIKSITDKEFIESVWGIGFKIKD